MNISKKIFLFFLFSSLLIAVVGFISIQISTNALENSIGNNANVISRTTIQEIDKEIFDEIRVFELFSNNENFREFVKNSNKDFVDMENPQEFINDIEKNWQSITIENNEIFDNPISKTLKDQQFLFSEQRGYNYLGEVFITNSFGVIIATTTKTTDYLQSDEGWWQEAKKYGFYVVDVEFDDSAGIYSVSIINEIKDQDGNFLGVMVHVVDVQQIFETIERINKNKQFESQKIILLNSKNELIYSTEPKHGRIGLMDFPEKKLISNFSNDEFNVFFDPFHNTTELAAFSVSQGFEKYDGLGWKLIVVYDANELFQPIVSLQDVLITSLSFVTFFAIIFGLYSSKVISKPIIQLKNHADLISKGKLGSEVIVSGNDEIAELSSSINTMTKNLRKMTDIEEQLAIQSNLKRAIDESSYVAITNKDGIITHVNAKFCESSKYTREELVGKNHRILKSHYHSPEYYKKMWDTITSGKVWHDQIKNKAKDGTFYWNDMVIVPFFDKDKKIQEYVSIRRDITERKKLHEEKLKNEKMVAIGQLASRLAHDMRNPLSIIQVALENIRMLYGGNEIQVKQFEKIERSIDRMTHQVDEVLDFVKGIPPQLNKVKFSEIIVESKDSLNIPENIKVVLPKNDIELLCDKRQLAIAMNNIILNGIQAIDGAGTIKITVEENDDVIVIQVKDSGKGMPKENLDKIFEPLYTTKQTGTGLGLSSVRSIIEAHGGIISVTSPPTVFTITFPKISDN